MKPLRPAGRRFPVALLYDGRPIEGDTLKELQALIEKCRWEGGLHLQFDPNIPHDTWS